MSIYRDSKRIVGTNTQRIGADAISGGWKEVGRTTLGSASSTITVSSLPDKRYYKVLTSITGQASNSDIGMRLNGDTGLNYARRFSTNGGSDISGTVTSLPYHYTDVARTTPIFAVAYLANKSDKEKLSMSHGIRETGTVSGAPSRFESVGKWANTSSAINEIQVLSSTNMNSGSECVVLGYDPDDTHTDNFWEQLVSDEASGSVASLESGTISAKKYLWIQCYISGTSASTFCETVFNNDTGSNYGSRGNQNGGTDFTRTSQSDLNMFESYSNTTGAFLNAFIINNSSNAKLGISHSVREGTSGAGNAPQRDEVVFKWANTSSQITDISFTPQSGTINSGSFMKVWGSN